MVGPYVVGNWKMRLSLAESGALADALAAAVQAGEGVVAVCPSFPCLATVAASLRGSVVALGAQDVSADERGAFTGEVAASVLVELGCRFVIVGHSERRTRHGESDELVGRKVAAVLRCGLTPVVCVGETAAERRQGQSTAVVTRQLRPVVAAAAGREFIVAYEPVWAISPQPAASGEEATAMLPAVRQAVAAASSVPVIYGGSVSPANVNSFVGPGRFAGVLVGAESVRATEFSAIAVAARQGFTAR
jgi:triosephosphate isomerase